MENEETSVDALSCDERRQREAGLWGYADCHRGQSGDDQAVRAEEQTLSTPSCPADSSSFWSDFLSISIPVGLCEDTEEQHMRGSRGDNAGADSLVSNTAGSRNGSESCVPGTPPQGDLSEERDDDATYETCHQKKTAGDSEKLGSAMLSSVQRGPREGSQRERPKEQSVKRLPGQEGVSESTNRSTAAGCQLESQEEASRESCGSGASRPDDAGDESGGELTGAGGLQSSVRSWLKTEGCSANVDVPIPLFTEEEATHVGIGRRGEGTTLESVTPSDEWQHKVSPEPHRGLDVSGGAPKRGSGQGGAQLDRSWENVRKGGASAEVPSPRRFVPALGATGRQLVLDRIRSRYHTDVVYYSGLLRDKYNSTISKLPFFTVSRLHQLAADFGIDTHAVLSGYHGDSSAGGRGGAGIRRGRPCRLTTSCTHRGGMRGRKEDTHGAAVSRSTKFKVLASGRWPPAQGGARLSRTARRVGAEAEEGGVAASAEVSRQLDDISPSSQQVRPFSDGSESLLVGGMPGSSPDEFRGSSGTDSSYKAQERTSSSSDNAGEQFSGRPGAGPKGQPSSTTWNKEAADLGLGTDVGRDFSRRGPMQKPVSADSPRTEKWAHAGGSDSSPSSSETSLPASGASTIGGDGDEVVSPRLSYRPGKPGGCDFVEENWHSIFGLQHRETRTEHLGGGSGQSSPLRLSEAADLTVFRALEETRLRRCANALDEDEEPTSVCEVSCCFSSRGGRDKKRPAPFGSASTAIVNASELRSDETGRPQEGSECLSVDRRYISPLDEFCRGRTTRRKVLQTTCSESTTFTSSPTTPTGGVTAELQSLAPPLGALNSCASSTEAGGRNPMADVKVRPANKADDLSSRGENDTDWFIRKH